jgi:ectoine hydroxylase
MIGSPEPGNREPARDLYPSRLGDSAGILDRLDPAVYCEPWAAGGGPLRGAQLLRFSREGFLSFEHPFTPREVDELLSLLATEIHRRRDDPAPELIREPGGEEIRSIFDVHRSHPAFARLAADRRLVGMAEQILGSRVYVHQSRVNVKPGFDGKEFYWHSDFETWHVEDGMPRMRALSISINLTANLSVNGPVMMIPGSHHHYVSCEGRTPPNHHLASLRKQEYGVPDRKSLSWLVERGGISAPTGGPGSMVVFDCNVMHGSGGNITPYPRTNVFVVYNSIENRLVEPFGGQPARPEYIASRDFRPVGEA